MARSGNEILIDGARLWETIMASARIGPGRAGGLRRLALSDPDREVRDLFGQWCRDSGFPVTVDRLGNMFARRRGRENDLPPVLVGSHLDTQIAGGRFDGIAGVLGGLELLRTLEERGIETKRPIEVVNWSNEEGARFAPPMSASAVFAGLESLEWGLSRTDPDGLTFGDELARIGYAGEAAVGGREIDAYFELHIEQGPILDETGVPVGVVTGCYPTRAYRIEVKGETSHAGPTPMAKRRNALVGAAMLVVAANEIGWAHAPDGKTTSTRIEVWPNLPGIVPDWAQVTIDMRHPDQASLDSMAAAFESRMAEAAKAAQVEMEVVGGWRFGTFGFDETCVALVRDAAARLGYAHMDLLSQAGHDAYNMAKIAPTAMIFTPCRDGITHNEAEDCSLQDLEPGVNVLLHVVLARADR